MWFRYYYKPVEHRNICISSTLPTATISIAEIIIVCYFKENKEQEPKIFQIT